MPNCQTHRPARFLPIAPAAILLPMMTIACAPTSELSVKNVHTVEPGVLIRGGQTDVTGLIALHRAYGVTTVVNLNDATAESERQVAKQAGLVYLALPASPFKPRSDQIVAFIKAVQDRKSGAVYVHCRDGMDRTGYAVASYRILVNGWTADAALRELRGYQTWPHAALFQNIPQFVRSVEANKPWWLEQIATPTTRPSSKLIQKENP